MALVLLAPPATFSHSSGAVSPLPSESEPTDVSPSPGPAEGAPLLTTTPPASSPIPIPSAKSLEEQAGQGGHQAPATQAVVHPSKPPTASDHYYHYTGATAAAALVAGGGSEDEAVEICRRLITISADKLMSGKAVRGGPRLHKSLLILRLVRRARQDFEMLPRDCANLLPAKEQYQPYGNNSSSQAAVVSQPQLTAPAIYHPNSKAARIEEDEEKEQPKPLLELEEPRLDCCEDEEEDDEYKDEKENEVPMPTSVNMTAHCETVFESQEDCENSASEPIEYRVHEWPFISSTNTTNGLPTAAAERKEGSTGLRLYERRSNWSSSPPSMGELTGHPATPSPFQQQQPRQRTHSATDIHHHYHSFQYPMVPYGWNHYGALIEVGEEAAEEEEETGAAPLANEALWKSFQPQQHHPAGAHHEEAITNHHCAATTTGPNHIVQHPPTAITNHHTAAPASSTAADLREGAPAVVGEAVASTDTNNTDTGHPHHHHHSTTEHSASQLLTTPPNVVMDLNNNSASHQHQNSPNNNHHNHHTHAAAVAVAEEERDTSFSQLYSSNIAMQHLLTKLNNHGHHQIGKGGGVRRGGGAKKRRTDSYPPPLGGMVLGLLPGDELLDGEDDDGDSGGEDEEECFLLDEDEPPPSLFTVSQPAVSSTTANAWEVEEEEEWDSSEGVEEQGGQAVAGSANRDRQSSGSTTSTTPPMEIVRPNQCGDSPPIPPTADGNHCTYESVPAFQLHTPQIRNVWLAPDLSRPRFPFYDDGQPQPMVVEYEGSLRGEWLVPPSTDSADSCNDSAADEPTSPVGGKQSGMGGGKDPDGDSGVDVNLCVGSGDELPVHHHHHQHNHYGHHSCQPSGPHHPHHFAPAVYQVVPGDRQHRHHGW